MDRLLTLAEELLDLASQRLGSDTIISSVVVGVFGIIGVLITVGGPDLRRNRQKRKLRARLKKACVHVELRDSDSNKRIVSLCDSLGNNPWTTYRLCGKRFTLQNERSMIDEWAKKNADERDQILEDALRKAVKLKERLDELDGE